MKMRWHYINMNHIELYKQRSIGELLHSKGFEVLGVHHSSLSLLGHLKTYINYWLSIVIETLHHHPFPEVSGNDSMIVAARLVR